MFFIALFAAVLLLAAVCIAQAVLSRPRRVSVDPPSPFASPALLPAAMSPPLFKPVSPRLAALFRAVVYPPLPPVPEATSSTVIFKPVSPRLAALFHEAMSRPLPSAPLFEAMPPSPPPPPPPAVDDEFLGLFDQMSITPPSQQVHRQTAEMWQVPERLALQEELDFGFRTFLRSLYLRARNRDHDNGGDLRRYAVGNNFLREHHG
ncbi:hypothetical protein BJV82DRAFT_661913 [Fennellomyces sp. T-0311]|nr:hypothetical protein BJV82DRAFT_661913 [Fennellomyces sp. T-0311]